MSRTSRLMTVLAGGLLLGTLAAPAVGAAPSPTAEPTEDPSPAATLAPVPDAVAAWFAEDGQTVVEGTTLAAEPEELVLGHPRQVSLWTAGYIAHDAAAEPAEGIDEWLAPVIGPPVEEEGDPVPVGAVWAGSQDNGDIRLVAVLREPDLAGALTNLPGAVTLVHDTGLDGWFALADGEVWPLGENARTVLQGSLAVDIFQDFVHERLGEPTAAPAPLPQTEADDELSPLVPIVAIIVLGAGTAWLLLRQYRRDDSRLAADIRAGVSPPRREAGPPRREPGR